MGIVPHLGYIYGDRIIIEGDPFIYGDRICLLAGPEGEVGEGGWGDG